MEKHKTTILCSHEKQCVVRDPKPPPPSKVKNGHGLTFLLPNQAFKHEIEKYEAEFGDHFCSDCNWESIWCETSGFYRVKSCGNRLIKFEGFRWWDGEGDFSSRDQQMFSIMIDL